MSSAKPSTRFELSVGFVNLFVRLAWVGVAFAVHTAFTLFAFEGSEATPVAVYAVAVLSTLGLHPSTRGRASMALALGLCSALFVEGLWFAATREYGTAGLRASLASALGLPLVLLLVRRRAIDDEDDWFAKHARGVVRIALPVSALALAGGVLGYRGADPAPYERAVIALGHSPFVAASDFMPAAAGLERDGERFAVFLGHPSVDRDIRDAVRAECGGLERRAPERASACAHELLVSQADARRKRRALFGALALASAIPAALALLFAWRGRVAFSRSGKLGA